MRGIRHGSKENGAHRVIPDEAVGRIALAQESTAAVLAAKIRDAELTLAHFLLVNQEKAMELASQYNLASGKDKSVYAQQLTQLFNATLLPRSNVIAGHPLPSVPQVRTLDTKSQLAGFPGGKLAATPQAGSTYNAGSTGPSRRPSPARRPRTSIGPAVT